MISDPDLSIEVGSTAVMLQLSSSSMSGSAAPLPPRRLSSPPPPWPLDKTRPSPDGRVPDPDIGTVRGRRGHGRPRFFVQQLPQLRSNSFCYHHF